MTTIAEFARRLRAGETTCEQTTGECLARIDAGNGDLNAFILVTADEALREAQAADRELAAGHDRGPLHGVPVSVKDIIDVRGLPTTAASRVREGHRAARDAAVIAHLRTAGAVLVGKTNLHEFALGTTNEESAFGPARNPHDRRHSPGGSSGGSAVSVATGMALATVGTDTGGSIRIPAAACGIVGLKPTFGELSTDGVVPLSPSLDHVGPLAQTVDDAWVVCRALAGDPTPRPVTPMPPTAIRLAVPRDYFLDLLDDQIRARFDEALALIVQAGTRVRDTAIAHAHVIQAAYLHLTLPEAVTYHASTLETMPERYTKPVRLRLEMGRYILAEDHVRARAMRDQLCREVDAAFAYCDALVLPTMPIPAPLIGADTVTIGESSQPVRNTTLRLTQLFNLTGHPAITLPCGATADGLPVGLQLVGARHRTDALVSVALACEAVLGAAAARATVKAG